MRNIIQERMWSEIWQVYFIIIIIIIANNIHF